MRTKARSIYLLAQYADAVRPAFKAAIDGFDIRGGDQEGQANTVTQGGAIFANAYVRNLQITNNVVESNSGSYGTVRIGTPDLPAPDTNQHNENLRIANNRIIANAGTNLAGGIGLFAGADNYEVADNDICGNFSAEYGGGISVYGFSPNGKIHHNRIYFNQSYDEGGGIMIAGELPADPTTLSPGSGPVDIYNNLIQANLANDDGGGLRFLMAGNFPMNVYNNMIVNNVSTHEGGGIGLNDAPNVRVYNNTIMKNITTATAVTSNGSPAPAGLSTSANSDHAAGHAAGRLAELQQPAAVQQHLLGQPGRHPRRRHRDGHRRRRRRHPDQQLGPGRGRRHGPAGADQLDPAAATIGYTASPTNSSAPTRGGRPPTTSALTFNAWRTNPNFIGAIMVTVDDLPTAAGQLPPRRRARRRIDTGAASQGGAVVPAPPRACPRRPSISTTRAARPAPASTSAPTKAPLTLAASYAGWRGPDRRLSSPPDVNRGELLMTSTVPLADSLSRRGLPEARRGRQPWLRPAASLACPRLRCARCCAGRAWRSAADAPPNLYFAGTDGWIYLPPNPAIARPIFPDDLAPADPCSPTYIFGFRNITGLTATQIGQPEDEGAAQRAAVLGRPVRSGNQGVPRCSSPTWAWRSAPT